MAAGRNASDPAVRFVHDAVHLAVDFSAEYHGQGLLVLRRVGAYWIRSGWDLDVRRGLLGAEGVADEKIQSKHLMIQVLYD